MHAGGGSGGENGRDGRLVLGRNTESGIALNTPSTHEIHLMDGSQRVGSRAENPHLHDPGTRTPCIPGLMGGAEAFGFTEIQATDPEFSVIMLARPKGAVAALALMDEGPASLAYDWDGYDMLLFLNLAEEDLNVPQLGVGPDVFLTGLYMGGWQTRAVFGGSGPNEMLRIPPLAVYATLVPEGSILANARIQGAVPISGAVMTAGETRYMSAPDAVATTCFELAEGVALMEFGEITPGCIHVIYRSFNLHDEEAWEPVGLCPAGEFRWEGLVETNWPRVYFRIDECTESP